jgi:hypothetical protein
MSTFFSYAVATAASPAKSMKRLLAEPRPTRRAALAVGFVGALYAAASFALAAVGAVPLATAFLRIAPENYYFWQTLFAVPYALLAWALVTGLMRLLRKPEQGGPAFEKTAALAGIALAAVLFIAWIPMAVVTLFMVVGMGQEELVDILSRPGMWQVLYIALYLLAGIAAACLLTLAVGLGHFKKAGRARTIIIGILAAAVFAGTFMMFMR